MTLKIFVAKDSEDREWPPNTPHEAEACEWMLQKAWMGFHHLEEMFAIVVNLKKPSADMVVIRELGLGVLEMKHHPGEITVDENGAWWAENIRIHSGPCLNPREQVRKYARQLREKILPELLPVRIQADGEQWDDPKFQTGVCFTNPFVDLRKLRTSLNKKPPKLEAWENDFSVIEIDFFTRWVRKLRFELTQNPPDDYSPIHLEPEKIMNIATGLLDAVEWDEMYKAMPEGNPYGHLILEDITGREVFNLTKDHSTLGRSHQCDVVIPSRYGRVSKHHLSIDRDIHGVTITDRSSLNGTFINDQSVEKDSSYRLENGAKVSLGGLTTRNNTCVLTFELSGEILDETTITEQSTRDFRQLGK